MLSMLTPGTSPLVEKGLAKGTQQQGGAASHEASTADSAPFRPSRIASGCHVSPELPLVRAKGHGCEPSECE
jgi:hypothetical protein